jgi:hypothetical protein
MNVLLHITSAIGVAVLLTDTKRIEHQSPVMTIMLTSAIGFLFGIIAHGALDYIPHGYPVNSKLDAIGGLIIIIVTILLTNKKYRIIIGLTLLGSLFPDLIDLSPSIANKQLGLSLPEGNKIFPWHWHEYSGSIYSGPYSISTLNHFLVILGVTGSCWLRLSDLQVIFSKSNKSN